MILIDNINILTEKFPELWRILKTREEKDKDRSIQVEKAKNGRPTISILQGDKTLCLHSRYNPKQEAERVVEQFHEMDKYKHVFFYGVGLGYHVEAFLKKYPDLSFTLFEPEPEILECYLSHKNLSDLPLKRLKEIYTETSQEETANFLRKFADFLFEEVLFVSLPSYERIFAERYQAFITIFRNVLTHKRYNICANMVYEKKWTINCLKNFEEIISTPNFLSETKKYFTGKPALIVAAGPSVEDEIENLRKIKEEGLAYIFAAGSGLHPLLNNGIIPDAACSYDPNDNTKVFKPVIEQKIPDIPLIFGSFIGFSRFKEYPGPKFHMIVNQDTLAPYYLRTKDGERFEVIIDCPTISGVILQLLFYLGCDPIIFVGQNLAFRGELSYAQGIGYYNPKVTEKKMKDAVLVEDVYGREIYSTPTFKMMKDNLEHLISDFRQRTFINTTKGGAKIKGAEFKPLEDLFEGCLSSQVVDSGWKQEKTLRYDLNHLASQQRKMDVEYVNVHKGFNSIDRILKQLDRLISQQNTFQLKQAFTQFDKSLQKLQNNLFYQVFIIPMKRVELEMIAKVIDEIRFESDPVAKARKIIKEFGSFITACREDLEMIKPHYERLQKVIIERTGEQRPTLSGDRSRRLPSAYVKR